MRAIPLQAQLSSLLVGACIASSIVLPACGRLHCKRSCTPVQRNAGGSLRTPGCQQLVRQPSLAQDTNPGGTGFNPHPGAFLSPRGRSCKPTLRVATPRSQIGHLRQASLPDLGLCAGCPCPVGQVTHCSPQCCGCNAAAHMVGGQCCACNASAYRKEWVAAYRKWFHPERGE